MNRGDRREDIFRDDRDREMFLAALAEACGKTGWEAQARRRMSNHLHLGRISVFADCRRPFSVRPTG
jgi:REP element-mobilizing transposase RayT